MMVFQILFLLIKQLKKESDENISKVTDTFVMIFNEYKKNMECYVTVDTI